MIMACAMGVRANVRMASCGAVLPSLGPRHDPMDMTSQEMEMARAIVARANIRVASARLPPRQVSRQDKDTMDMNGPNVEMARAIVARANIRVASGGAQLPRQVL